MCIPVCVSLNVSYRNNNMYVLGIGQLPRYQAFYGLEGYAYLCVCRWMCLIIRNKNMYVLGMGI